MKITDRIKKAVPNSKCYWNNVDSSVSVHVPANAMLNNSIQIAVAAAINMAGLSEAVTKINVIRFEVA